MNIYHSIILLLTALVLSACASSPKFDTNGIDTSITPQGAVDKVKSLQGVPVLWGGVIIASNNLKDSTQLEILAYPLDVNQKPDAEKTPLGRILAEKDGYLETTDFTQGRLITVRGTLKDNRKGHIGETKYTYPVVNINQIHLWSKQRGFSEPRIQFGIGVMFHN